jgi:protein-tyrosine phosphatase
MMPAMTKRRMDVHAHLIPGVDDGCGSLAESIECGRALAAAGYSDCVCTPHVWPNLAAQTRDNVVRWVGDLQQAYDEANVGIKLWPGSELNLSPAVMQTPPQRIITYALRDRHILVDMWADTLPEWFEPTIRWLQSMHLTVILAHPERMRAIQDRPELADRLAELGILLQGNLQCFADRPDAHTRITAERYLREGRYFLLGSDTHNPAGIAHRLKGLENAIELAGEAAIDRLTVQNPRVLIDAGL